MNASRPRDYVHRFLGSLPPWAIVALGLLGMAALAIVDYATGYEYSFAVFYVFPVSVVAWYAGWVPAIVVSIACAASWEEANRLAGQLHSSAAVPVWNALTRLGFFLIVAALLVALKQTLARERALSRVDDLTGVSNRRAFVAAAQAELARLGRTAHPLTTVYIDLDDFKAVNDRLGHAAGDRLLARVAGTLRSSVRVTDSVARLGGDEFGLLLPHTDDVAARVLVDKLHAVLRDLAGREQWGIGFSMGALTCQSAPPSVDAMMAQADAMMYEVKNAGKNAVRYAVYPGA